MAVKRRTIWISDEEWADICSVAKERGLNVSEFIRDRVLIRAVPVEITREGEEDAPRSPLIEHVAAIVADFTDHPVRLGPPPRDPVAAAMVEFRPAPKIRKGK